MQKLWDNTAASITAIISGYKDIYPYACLFRSFRLSYMQSSFGAAARVRALALPVLADVNRGFFISSSIPESLKNSASMLLSGEASYSVVILTTSQ